MTLDDPAALEGLDRDRLEADRRYNGALTAFDRAVLDTGARDLAREDFDRIATPLVVFLQQITAFVDSKDRLLAGETGARLDTLERALDSIAELRAQVGILQRATEALRRTVPSPQSSGVNPQPSTSSHQPFAHRHDLDYKYLGFEDQFRGSDAVIKERLRAYLPIFDGRSDVLDLGCGRGELLSALQAGGIRARGIDANRDMVAVALERGLDATEADALGYITSLPDASLGGVIATQVVEHLEPGYLMRLLDATAGKLRPGAPIVLETINPACWLAFFSSFIRDFTHVRPVHPETLQYLLRASGFERVEIRYSAPVPDHMKMKPAALPADILGATDASSRALQAIAHAVNANAAILNNLMFTHLDYAAIGYRG